MPTNIGLQSCSNRNPARWLLCLLALLLPAAVAAPSLFGNAGGPEAKPAGGSCERSCIRCHTTSGLNDAHALGGVFKIDGSPRNYQAGQTYPMTVTIGQPGQSRWGFQLSARFAGSAGQAGRLAPADRYTQIKTEGDLLYLMHTEEGSQKGERDGPVEFLFNWTAPDPAGGMVIFNATGNASDASGTPSGDYIYTAGSFSAPAAAPQQEAAPVEVEAEPAATQPRVQETSRLVSLPVPTDLKRGTAEIQIQHRFFESLADSTPGGAFGIDSGANIFLGFNYGISDRLSVGIGRARVDQVIEMAGTYELRTAKESPWKFALRGGVEGRQNFRSHYSPFVQLPVAYDYRRLRVTAVPTMVFNSRPDALVALLPQQAIHPGSNHTFALGLGADLAVARKVSLLGEYVPRLAGFGGFFQTNPQLAGGVAIRTWGHVFSIIVATSRDMTPGKYGVNAESRDVALGFNIYRRIR